MIGKLKLCPFCGSNDIIIFKEHDDEVSGSTYITFFRGCGTRGGIDHVGQGVQDAAMMWNKRAEE